MTTSFKLYSRFASIVLALTVFSLGMAQNPYNLFNPDTVKFERPNVKFDHNGLEIPDDAFTVRDTADYVAPTTTIIYRDSILDPMRVVTNKFGKNWFVFATGGVHTFRGDYSNVAGFKGTLSPDFSVGIGKWFTPGIALKVEFIRSDSRGYTEYLTGHYGYGDLLLNSENTPYRKMKTAWWDISGSVVLNLSRLFLGYEGYNSPKRKSQFMFSAGIGGVHHMGYGHSYGSDNEWGGHLELQYSQFFTRAKRFSLDLKARGIFYESNFDLEYGQANHAANKFDCNVGLALGFTFYLGKGRAHGWGKSSTAVYRRDYRESEILIVSDRPEAPATSSMGRVDYGTFTFYVFYPNNYSGRNDAPIVKESSVNALDYLAGGIYTQKKYKNNGDVASRLLANAKVYGLPYTDIPTEPANRNFDINMIPRGYEMVPGTAMSLSLTPEAMTQFREKAGYYYAPIFDGSHVWQYRIDDATLGQQLLSPQNYAETQSFGLNGHSGLETISSKMNIDKGDYLVSFADVYAAIKGNEGYVAQFADSATVARLREILDEGIITMIQAEGLATSQDNYSGEGAKQVGLERNTALSQNRANTVIEWLKECEPFSDVSSQIYLVNSMEGPIRKVTDPSTRGLNAKLNRCVKVKIHYLSPN